MSKKYYAFVIDSENKQEIVRTWDECQKKIKGKNSRYKSFKSFDEATLWLKEGGLYTEKKKYTSLLKQKLLPGIYFDAGTGRKIGVEVRVTDLNGTSILDSILPNNMINEFGNYLANEGSTNNYGELIGAYLAFEIAIKQNILNIFGDSKLVIDFWSKGICNKASLNEKTITLIEKTKEKRKIFESLGGKIEHISGDINPADLGFHK